MGGALKIGVVCEGPTDYFAIVQFMGHALKKAGIAAHFIDLQPEMDRTQPQAGWGFVEIWLKDNPVAVRMRRYLGGGLFDDELDAKVCDLFLVQMDSDVLEEEGFRKHLKHKYGYSITDLSKSTPADRGAEIWQILWLWSGLGPCTEAERKRHVLVPAVESTETWCVAAFGRTTDELEGLRGTDLATRFMRALLRSEGRTRSNLPSFSTIDKDVGRRRAYCERHARGSGRVRQYCEQFDRGVRALVDFARGGGGIA